MFFSCSNYPDCDVIANDLDHVLEKYQDHPKTPYVSKKKTTPKKKEPKTKKTASKKPAKELALSKDLAKVVQSDRLARTQVTKKVWDYIKEHKLQDPSNKRLIRPDALLAKVFGSKAPLDMMQLAKVLSLHIQKE